MCMRLRTPFTRAFSLTRTFSQIGFAVSLCSTKNSHLPSKFPELVVYVLQYGYKYLIVGALLARVIVKISPCKTDELKMAYQ